METLHALIVHMFPQKLTASMLKSPNTAILIKDEARNVFYELEDVRDIQDRSIIKIYRKEPVYGSYTAAAHLANGDLRVSVGGNAQTQEHFHINLSCQRGFQWDSSKMLQLSEEPQSSV